MLLLLTFPFQIQALFLSDTYFFIGHFNPFTHFFLSSSDLIFLVIFFTYGMGLVTQKPSVKADSSPDAPTFAIDENHPSEKFFLGTKKSFRWYVLFLGSFLLGGVFLSSTPLLSGALFLRFLELIFFYFLILNQILPQKLIIRLFIYSLLFQALLALGQFGLQSSIGLRILGEPILSPLIAGVAKWEFMNFVLLRPYGTFPHPNVLAGALLSGFWLSFYIWKNERKRLFGAFALLFFLTLCFTFSRSALLALFLGFAVYYVGYYFLSRQKKYLFPAFAFFLIVVAFGIHALRYGDPNALMERVLYLKASYLMFLTYPFGVGLGNFTRFLQNFTDIKLMPWIFQPVHNVFMLIANEGGGAAFTFFTTLILSKISFLKQKILSFSRDDEWLFSHMMAALFSGFIFIFFVDHYFVTLFQGQMLLFLVFAFIDLEPAEKDSSSVEN